MDVLNSTLQFATQLQYPTLCSFTVRRLENEIVPTIEHIVISRQSTVPSWVQPALDELCVREAPISFTEAIKPGMKTFVGVATRREAYKSTAGHGLVEFKAALCKKTHGGSGSAETHSRCSHVIDSQQRAGHKSALDHIITAAFNVVSSKAPSNNGY